MATAISLVIVVLLRFCFSRIVLRMTFQKILITVELGHTSEHALNVGVELAQSLRAEMAFVHAVDSGLGFAPDTGITPSEHLALAKTDGEALLAGVRTRLALEPRPVEFLVVGTPGDEIVRVATEWRADLVVVGCHGRGGVSRFVLGSVAEYVMRHAPCPVVIVRATS